MRIRLGAIVLVAAAFAQDKPAAPPPKPLVPMAASTLIANHTPHVGQTVTIYAPVERRLSATSFSVDQDKTKASERDLLVLTRGLYGEVDANAYVTVIGEVVTFDAAAIASRALDYVVDLPADLVARYKGQPAILATAVITATVVDLTKRPPAPMTADEEAYDKVMKRVGPAFNALRQAVTGSNADGVKQQAAALAQAFAEADAFWKKRGAADAVQWAQEAKKHVAAIDRAASNARWDDLKTAAAGLAQICQNCHGAYRERLDDGSYRIRSAK